MVLNNSLYHYAWVFEKETLLEVIEGHIQFFRQIGGVPKTIFYDNLKVVVDDSKEKRINEHFLQFSSFFNFTPVPCNPSSPNEKGTDEETVGFVRNYCFCQHRKFLIKNAAINIKRQGLRMMSHEFENRVGHTGIAR
jgi:transposase